MLVLRAGHRVMRRLNLLYDLLYPFAEEQGSADHPFCGLNGQPQKESARDRMIRLGEMTPFGTVLHGATAKGESSGSKLSAFEQFLLDKQKNFRIKDKKPLKKNSLSSSQHRHHSKKSSDKASSSSSSTQPFSIFHKKDKKANIEQVDNVQKVFQRKRSYPVAPDLSEDGEIRDENCDKDKQILENSDSDYEPECTDNDDSEGNMSPPLLIFNNIANFVCVLKDSDKEILVVLISVFRCKIYIYIVCDRGVYVRA